MRALLVGGCCVTALLLLGVVYFGPGQSIFKPGSRSELAGEVDLDDPFPGVSEFGAPGLFEKRLADGSRVSGHYARTGRDSEWTRHSPEGVLLVRANYLDGKRVTFHCLYSCRVERYKYQFRFLWRRR